MTETKKPRTRKAKPVEPEVLLINMDSGYFTKIGFDTDWIIKLAQQYGFDRMEYVHKFRAFRCYKQEQHIEWTDVNELAILNGKRPLDVIVQKHQPLSKARQIIYRPWR